VSRSNRSGRSYTLLIGGVIFPSLILLGVLDLIIGGSSTQAPSMTAAVLDAKYAKTVGFPKTVQAAKRTKVTTQEGCTDSVESVYEDARSNRGLLAEVLECKSEGSAAAALGAARKETTLDKSVRVPRQLGTSAFFTDTEPHEYIIVWQAGSRLVLTAIDVDIKASSSTTTEGRSKPLTASQQKTLTDAAMQENSLLN
jgi:hypothetical protein